VSSAHVTPAAGPAPDVPLALPTTPRPGGSKGVVGAGGPVPPLDPPADAGVRAPAWAVA